MPFIGLCVLETIDKWLIRNINDHLLFSIYFIADLITKTKWDKPAAITKCTPMTHAYDHIQLPVMSLTVAGLHQRSRDHERGNNNLIVNHGRFFSTEIQY